MNANRTPHMEAGKQNVWNEREIGYLNGITCSQCPQGEKTNRCPDRTGSDTFVNFGIEAMEDMP